MANLFIFLTIFATLTLVEPHGYLEDPPARGSMWALGWDTPQNYNHMQMFCGGKQHQYQTNGGKCGVCGDPYDAPQPRENEGGGVYSSGIISKCFEKTASVIEVKVQITANHLGYFEFRLCEHNNPFTPVTQECLDEHVLSLSDGEGSRYYIGPELGEYTVQLQLPENVQCSQCVLQWKYNTGNSWGCENDLCGLGYGEQEQFYGCADVSVLDSCQNFDHYQYVNGGTVTPKPTTLTPSSNMTSSTSSPVSTTMKPATTAQPSSTTSKPISTTTIPISTTPKPISTSSTPRPTTSSASTTQKPVYYGECYPNSFMDDTEEFNEICTFACSKNVCLSFYCDCEEIIAPTQQSTTLMSILTSTPSPPSSTPSPSSSSSSSSSPTTQSSKTCQDIEVTEAYKNTAGMLEWCIQQCLADRCTPSHCIC